MLWQREHDGFRRVHVVTTLSQPIVFAIEKVHVDVINSALKGLIRNVYNIVCRPCSLVLWSLCALNDRTPVYYQIIIAYQ